MVKRWFQSKTIWWNIAMFIVAALLNRPLVLTAAPAMMIVTSIINLYLRFKTKEECRF